MSNRIVELERLLADIKRLQAEQAEYAFGSPGWRELQQEIDALRRLADEVEPDELESEDD